MTDFKNIGIITNNVDKSLRLKQKLLKLQNVSEIYSPDDVLNNKIDVFVILGGDGFMLHSIHNYMKFGIPFYGINCGSIGFLMNQTPEKIESIIKNINDTKQYIIHPLKAVFTDLMGKLHEQIAINEISILRNTYQTTHIKITIDNETRLDELIGDGVIVATPAGSTCYNSSLNGPILPIGTQLLALTPISPFSPRGWKGALLPYTSEVIFEILDSNNRKAKVIADYVEFDDIKEVKIKIDETKNIKLLFDSASSIEERVIKEQFMQNSSTGL